MLFFRFGRLPTLVVCSLGSCIGLLKVFATTYYVYVIIELLEATISGGGYTAAMVLSKLNNSIRDNKTNEHFNIMITFIKILLRNL